MTSGTANGKGKVDVEFTLALNNKTGKYFFGVEMLAASSDLVRDVYYWRLPFKKRPEGLFRRILGRLALWDTQLHDRVGIGPLIRTNRPMVFVDPREVIFADLKPYDVVMIHDMGPLSHPDLYGDRVEHIYRKAFEKVKAAKPFLMFSSEASKDAFVSYYGSDYPCLRMVYAMPRRDMAGNSEPMPGMPEKYILTVGAIGRRKNQESALKAYAKSGLHERGIGYVICGGPEPGAEGVMDLARQTPGVVLTGYASDAQLRWLYANTVGFVLPSRLEGFGVPAMEAIIYRAMPLITRGGALNEVTSDEAILVDDTIDSIADGMNRLADLDPAERNRRLDIMQEHIKKFDPDNVIGVWRQTLSDAIKSFETTR